MLISTSSAYLGRSGGTATSRASARAMASLAATARSEQALRAQEQHDHEETEDHELLERAGQEGGPEGLGQAHDEPAQEGAQEIAHAPQHHDHEGHDVEALAHVGRHVEERS